ncbi:MAG: hypothetical protein ABH919_01830 [bacterium]
MNKKKIIISALVVLLFIVGAMLYSWQLEEYAKWHKYVPTNEFTIKEADGKKIIKHKGTKLTMEIPIDWQIEKDEESLFFKSPDFELYSEEENYSFPIFKKGCGVLTYISKEKKVGVYEMEYDDLQNQINWYLESPEEYKASYSDTTYYDEIIKINGNYAIRNIYSSKEDSLEDESVLSGKYISLKIPKNKYIYVFETYLFSENKDQCEQDFNKFLETIVIK